MKDKIEKPGKAGTSPSPNNDTTNLNNILPQDQNLKPIFYSLIFVYKRLIKISEYKGIPSQILAESAVTRWVLFNWDNNNDNHSGGRGSE